MHTSRVRNKRDDADPDDRRPIVVRDPSGSAYSIYVGPVGTYRLRLGEHGGRRETLRIFIVRDDDATFEAGTFLQDESARARRQAKVVADEIASGKHVPGQHSLPVGGDAENHMGQFWLLLGVSLAVTVTLLVAASHVTTTPWHVALVVLGVITSLYTLYLVVIVALVGAVAWMIDEYSKPRAKRLWAFRCWPFWVWPIVALLGLMWPPIAALSGYDASEWLWQGVSAYAGIIVILAIFFRRRTRR